jgi:predicted dehydrogenase
MVTDAGQFSKKPRVIVVGAGLMGRCHAATIRHVGAQIVAVVDRDLERAQALALRCRGAVASNDLNQALRRFQPTIAHLCTPAGTHRVLAEELAAAKVHVFIEKPLAGSEADTRAILGAFDRAGVIACPVHQYAFQRSVELVMAAKPSLGTVRRIAFDIRSAGAGDDATSQDRVAAEIVPHPLSIIQRLMPGLDIGALNWALERAAPGEWLASASSNGVLLSIAISMGGRPTRFATIVSGSCGTAELDNFHDFLVVSSGTVSRAAKISQPFIHGGKSLSNAALNLAGRTMRGERSYPGLRTLTRRFYAAAQSAGQFAAPISAAETIAVAVARDALLAQCPEALHG